MFVDGMTPRQVPDWLRRRRVVPSQSTLDSLDVVTTLMDSYIKAESFYINQNKKTKLDDYSRRNESQFQKAMQWLVEEVKQDISDQLPTAEAKDVIKSLIK